MLDKKKEISGELVVNRMYKDKNKIIFEFIQDIYSIIVGKKEEVVLYQSKTNFHTHPRIVYISNNVNKGWPSFIDYIGFIRMNGICLFHVIPSLEGIYIISYSQYWCNRKLNISEKFIKNNFNIDRNADISILDYIYIVNNINYKGFPIFKVKYMKWNNASSIFKIYY
jgi:hypothetical protein